MSTTRQRPGRRGTTAPGAPVVVLLGGHAAARGTCRVEAPGRVLRMWSMLNAANEELHQGRCRRRLCRACSDCWTLCGRITVDGETLTIRAERGEEENEAHRSEFRYGSFTRSVALPDRADTGHITARYDKGILEVSVPVPAVKAEGHRVTITKAS